MSTALASSPAVGVTIPSYTAFKFGPDLVRVKDKFQVTLPAAVRKFFKIAEGDFIELRCVDGEIRIKPRAEVVGAVSGAKWYEDYCANLPENEFTQELTDKDIVKLVKELRN